MNNNKHLSYDELIAMTNVVYKEDNGGVEELGELEEVNENELIDFTDVIREVDTLDTIKLYPVSVLKILSKMDEIQDDIMLQRKNLEKTQANFQILNKQVRKMIMKHIQPLKSAPPKTPRKKRGFALPVPISNELCEFMGLENDAKHARTEITKFISKYIKNNNLQSTEDKKVIIPDEKLWKLLGENDRTKTITFFNIQKYLNQHFL